MGRKHKFWKLIGNILGWFSISIIALFLLSNFVHVIPYTQILFIDFDSFSKKAGGSMLYLDIPSSAQNNKYYYKQSVFALKKYYGLSVMLSEDDYKKVLNGCIERYTEDQGMVYIKELSIMNSGKLTSTDEAFISENQLKFYKKFIDKQESLEDYSVVVREKIESQQNWSICILANDNTHKIIELSYRNNAP